MKRIISVMMACMMLLSLCACSGGNNQQKAEIAQLERETLELLDVAYDYCESGMSYILRAWNFSTEHSANKQYDEDELWNEFTSYMGMSDTEFADALVYGCDISNRYIHTSSGLSKLYGAVVVEAEYAVQAAKYAYLEAKKSIGINAKLDDIKTKLQEIAEKSEEYGLTEESEVYDLLTKSYLLVKEMYDWIYSPSGSYNSSSSALKDYKKEYARYAEELDLKIAKE